MKDSSINKWIKRSLLFVPGNKIELYQKAINSPADLIIIDWEDSVIQEDKMYSRIETFYWFNKHLKQIDHLAIRINSIKSTEGIKDLLFLSQKRLLPRYLLIPKVEFVENLTMICELLDQFTGEFIVLIESAKGAIEIERIITHSRIAAIMIGSLDLSTNLNCENTRNALSHSFSEILLHCAAFDIPLIDSPSFNLMDLEEFESDTREGKLFGASARAAIHPNQLDIINQVYTPTKKELSNAKLVLQTAQDGVGIINGHMIDLASKKKAKKIIELAETLREK